MKIKREHKPMVVCKPRITLQILTLIMQVILMILLIIILRWSFGVPIVTVCFGGYFIVGCFLAIVRYPPEIQLTDDGITIKKLGKARFYNWSEIEYAIEFCLFKFNRRLIIGSKSFPKSRILYGFDIFRLRPSYKLSYQFHTNYVAATGLIQTKLKDRYRQSRDF